MRLLEGLSENGPAALKLFQPLFYSRSGPSSAQLGSLIEQYQCAILEAAKLVLGRTAKELATRLRPESWSAAECVDHLARTTNSFLPAISKAVATAPALITKRRLRTGTVASLMIRNLEPPYRLRYRVIAPLAPEGTSFDAAWLAFQQSQSRLAEAVHSGSGLAIDKVTVPCPVCTHVTYNAYGAFRMLAAHQRRHLWQVQRILSALDRRERTDAEV